MLRSADLAFSRSVTGRMASASATSFSFTARLARYSSSSAAATASLAAKNESWAVLNRVQSTSSSCRLARPASRHRLMRLLKAPAVAAQSVLLARLSASATSFCLMTRASDWAESSWAKYVRRALSKLFRAALKRCHRLASASLSIRTPPRCSAFHSVKQLAHPGPAGLPLDPLRVLGGDLLGRADDLGATGLGGLLGDGPLGRLLGPADLDEGTDRGDLRVQRREVTDDIGAGHPLGELGVRLGGLPGRHRGVVEPLEEQVGAGHELVILWDEVADGVLGAGTG